MRRNIKMAVLLTAAVVVLAGTALAVTRHWDVLRAFFDGDVSPAETLVDRQARTVSDANYAFTVDSSVSDGDTTFLLIRVDALSQAGKARLNSDDFEGIDTFDIYPLVADPDSGEPVHPESCGASFGEVAAARTETSRTWTVSTELSDGQVAVAVYARLGYMDKGLAVEVPVTQTEAVTVQVGASGRVGTHSGPITLDSVTVSPFTIRMDVSWSGTEMDAPIPPVLIRMADGTLRGFSQMTEYGGQRIDAERDGGIVHNSIYRRFRAVQDLSQLTGIVIFGKEYPLDGSAPYETEADAHLLPFTLPLTGSLGEGLEYSLPVRALCEGVGASCDWDAGSGVAALTYRGHSLVLTRGSKTALVDGRSIELDYPPDVLDGALCAAALPFLQYWDIDCTVVLKSNGAPEDCWLITP